jgi:hypothetical protein
LLGSLFDLENGSSTFLPNVGEHGNTFQMIALFIGDKLIPTAMPAGA